MDVNPTDSPTNTQMKSGGACRTAIWPAPSEGGLLLGRAPLAIESKADGRNEDGTAVGFEKC
jgi:hypothetical protein